MRRRRGRRVLTHRTALRALRVGLSWRREYRAFSAAARKRVRRGMYTKRLRPSLAASIATDRNALKGREPQSPNRLRSELTSRRLWYRRRVTAYITRKIVQGLKHASKTSLGRNLRSARLLRLRYKRPKSTSRARAKSPRRRPRLPLQAAITAPTNYGMSAFLRLLRSEPSVAGYRAGRRSRRRRKVRLRALTVPVPLHDVKDPDYLHPRAAYKFLHLRSSVNKPTISLATSTLRTVPSRADESMVAHFLHSRGGTRQLRVLKRRKLRTRPRRRRTRMSLYRPLRGGTIRRALRRSLRSRLRLARGATLRQQVRKSLRRCPALLSYEVPSTRL